ncbi:hypothetical protein DIPPA_24775 [Diplonema papillatum]|nr:hypothetical protein DIPPA_24775 [Diplonema papillatum]
MLLSRKRCNVTLCFGSAPYPVLHCGFRTRGVASDYDAFPVFTGPPGDLVVYSGMQLTENEKLVLRGRVQTPPAPLEMKNTIVVFLQTADRVYHLVTEEQGTVAIICGHGVRCDARTGVPFVDLSYCYLEHSFLHEVVPSFEDTSAGVRRIKATQPEVQHLREYMACHARCLKVQEPHRDVPARAVKYFTRVLMPPLLYRSDTLTEEALSKDPQQLKELANVWVKEKEFSLAIEGYRTALRALDGLPPTPERVELKVQCLANVAHRSVNVPGGIAHDTGVAACDEALELLEKSDNRRLVAKMAYTNCITARPSPTSCGGPASWLQRASPTRWRRASAQG